MKVLMSSVLSCVVYSQPWCKYLQTEEWFGRYTCEVSNTYHELGSRTSISWGENFSLQLQIWIQGWVYLVSAKWLSELCRTNYLDPKTSQPFFVSTGIGSQLHLSQGVSFGSLYLWTLPFSLINKTLFLVQKYLRGFPFMEQNLLITTCMYFLAFR